jgi:hypothetical protein
MNLRTVLAPSLLLGLAAVGCAGLPKDTRLQYGDLTQALQAPPGKSVLVILGSDDHTNWDVTVFDGNKQCLGAIQTNFGSVKTVDPGKYSAISVGNPSSGINLELAAGKTYFLSVDDMQKHELTPIKPGTRAWLDVDQRLFQLRMNAWQPDDCSRADFNADLYDKTKQAIANLPPALAATDGVVWKTSAQDSGPPPQ